MRRRKNPLLNILHAGAVVGLASLLRILPLPAAHGVARLLGRVALAIVPRLKRIARDNLRRAFGASLNQAEEERIISGAMDNMAIVAAEFVRIRAHARHAFAGLVRIDGEEHVDKSRGAIFAGGHLANWEWMAPVCGSLGYRMAEIVRPLDNPLLDRWVNRVRESGNIRTIAKQDAGAEALRLLKEGWFVGILLDQSPRESAVPATFFGAPCWATAGPALLAMRARMPIHVVALVRDAPMHYTLRVSPPINISAGGSFRTNLQQVTQECQNVFESFVRAHPDQWLWFHRRWKKRDRLEMEWAEKRGAKTEIEAQRAAAGREAVQ